MKKYIIENINGEDVAIRNEVYWKKREQEKYELLLKKSGIPKNYWDLDFSDYQGELSVDSKSKCEQYAKNCKEDRFHNINLYLVGNHSAQKSMCACAIGKEFIRQGLKVKFVYAGKLIKLLLDSNDFNLKEECYFKINDINNSDLLIIDDIFDIEKSKMYINNPHSIIAEWDTFLRNFIHEDRRIVMTSNYTVEQVKKDFGESLYQLTQRDFVELMFYDDIKIIRRDRFKNLWREK